MRDGGFLWVSCSGRGLFVKEPLVQTFVCHLAEGPGADEALGVARKIKGQVWVRCDGIRVVVMGDIQV